jgi:hypothetical protein
MTADLICALLGTRKMYVAAVVPAGKVTAPIARSDLNRMNNPPLSTTQ